MIEITPNAPQRSFKTNKIVVVHTGHVITGWEIRNKKFAYNNKLNGIIAYGNGDDSVQQFMWFEPCGCVPIGRINYNDGQQAIAAFRSRYYNRPILWINEKMTDGGNVLLTGADSHILTHQDLQIPQYEGNTLEDFKNWCDPILDKVNSVEVGWHIKPQL